MSFIQRFPFAEQTYVVVPGVLCSFVDSACYSCIHSSFFERFYVCSTIICIFLNYIYVTVRFSGAHSHFFLNDFLQSVAGRYQESKRPRDFILDLLKLHVPTLLIVQYGEGEGIAREGEKVQMDFKQFLHKFIQRNALKHSLLKEMSAIMVRACIHHATFDVQSIATVTNELRHIHLPLPTGLYRSRER